MAKQLNMELDNQDYEVNINSDPDRKLVFNPTSLTWKQDLFELIDFVQAEQLRISKLSDKVNDKAEENEDSAFQDDLSNAQLQLDEASKLFQDLSTRIDVLFGNEATDKITQGVDSLDIIAEFLVKISNLLSSQLQLDRNNIDKYVGANRTQRRELNRKR